MAPRCVLIDRGGDLSAKNEIGTPLHNAVRNQNHDICTLLLDRGAAVNATDDDSETPLHTAVRQANKALCDFLLLQGVVRNKNEMCTLLLDRGGDVHAKNNTGDTPLQLASKSDLRRLLRRDPGHK